VRRLKERGIQTEYVNEYYLSSRLSPDRVAYLEGILKTGENVSLNTDFRPISYYYDMVLWSTRFTRPWRNIFSRLNQRVLWGFFSLLYLSILAFGFFGRRNSGAKKRTVILAVGAAGLAEITFQVVILLAFQILYGYLYYKLGIILSLFMLGLVLGSRLVTNRLETIKDDYGLFIKTHMVISVYPLILPLVFYALNAAGADRQLAWIGSNIIFPFLPIVAGFAGGFQFPLANRIILKNSGIIGRTSGVTYGMDLLGACVGALLVSAFLVPILGITRTCVSVAVLNFIVLAALMLSRRE
jgi:spermidine synthase